MRLRNRIDLTHLCRRMQSVLQILLNISFCPNIEVKDIATNEGYLAVAGDTVTLRIEGLAEARLMILNLPYDEATPLLVAPTVTISAGNVRSELSWACVVALAIALGEELNTDIIDDSLLLLSGQEVNPAHLLNKIKLVDQQSDVFLASHQLLKGLKII